MRAARLLFAVAVLALAACAQAAAPGVDAAIDAVDALVVDTPTDAALTVARSGTGTGTVTSSPAGVSCGASCTARFALGSTVTLNATPTAGSAFVAWGGACTGASPICNLTINADTDVTAEFGPALTQVTVIISGPGAGAVTSSPAGLNCGNGNTQCAAPFAPGTVVTLTQAAGGAIFNGWSGAGCTGLNNCMFTVGNPVTVTAAYRAIRVAIAANPTSCLRNPGEAGDRLRLLLGARGHTAVFAAATELDTATELALHDVIVLGGPGASCGDPGAMAYDGLVDAYVRTTGRGVIASGWYLYVDRMTPNLDALLPSTRVNNYFTGPQTVAPVAGHPITVGVTSFPTLQWLPWGGGPKPGATSLLSVGTTSVGSAWTVGNGRSVYLGPMFMESGASYDNEPLLDGTLPTTVELMLRSIEWAAKAR